MTAEAVDRDSAPAHRPLVGRSALVTGASRGIGEAVARALAQVGAQVFLLGRSADRLDELAQELDGVAVIADLADSDSVEEGTARVVEILGGPPDVVVNAAGVFTLASLASTPIGDLDLNYEVNLRGTFLVIRSVLPAMLLRGEGLLVNVGSVAGHRAFPDNAAYSASKFGLRGMHEVLLEEIRGTGVRATLIEPGACDTPMWDDLDPDGTEHLPDRADMLRPSHVAEAVVFAATRPTGVQIPLLRIERSGPTA